MTSTTIGRSVASTALSTVASAISATLATGTGALSTSTTSENSTRTSSSLSQSTTSKIPPGQAGSAQSDRGIGIVAFLTALATSVIIFAVQMGFFLLLRNKLARIFKPKTYLVPERERTDAPPVSFVGMFKVLVNFRDREIINKCGLDAYFFLRYLRTLLIIFIPIAVLVIPILVPLNYVGGVGQSVIGNDTLLDTNQIRGLDTMAWGNVAPENMDRYWAHLILALCVIAWVCTVFFFELRVYIKVRQDYLTSAEHRLRASATTVLVNNVPRKWLTEDALNGLFDVFPGGVRNVWLTRDLTELLDKIKERDSVTEMLEVAETELIKKVKKKQLKLKEMDEKRRRKEMRLQDETKQEREARMRQEDDRAKRVAEGDGGVSSEGKEDVPHNVTDGVAESKRIERDVGPEKGEPGPDSPRKGGLHRIGDPAVKFGHGIKSGVGKAGHGLRGLTSAADNVLASTGGFTAIPTLLDGAGSAAHPSPRGSEFRRANKVSVESERPGTAASDPFRGGHSRAASAASAAPASPRASPEKREGPGGRTHGATAGNTVRKLSNLEDMFDHETVRFWQFWKPPSGGYASPVPQTAAKPEDHHDDPCDPLEKKTQTKKKKQESQWARIWAHVPIIGGYEIDPIEYLPYHDPDYRQEEEEAEGADGDHEATAEWARWLKKSDRPTHRLPLLGYLPGLPLLSKKVDAIYWSRAELARLNMEIEEDQKHPDRYPLMRSAFIQFNHQVAAHMACQGLIHHLPKQMAPREIEISPRDVIWGNMALTWWQEWLRTGLALTLIAFMTIFWAIPVAWTAAVSQLDELISKIQWLRWIDSSPAIRKVALSVTGVLPAAILGLLLWLVPIMLEFLATFKGAKTGSQRSEFVQIFYFAFLFVQVFLVVSITSFFAASFDRLFKNFQSLHTVQDVLNLLARNLPQAANYFFAYMILQAMSTSSGTVLQIGALVTWYLVARVFDVTARHKWNRNVGLSDIKWGSFFPVYTNFACIGLVYSIVAPLISIFSIVTFSLLWVAQRYSMLYITRFETDTGGVLYPRAINQTFTGLYVMELCLIGLFSSARNQYDQAACTKQAIIMVVALILTITYQVLLNYSFSPLFRYLPITFEDEAVLRDELFQRAQDRRLGLIDEEVEEEEEEEEGEEEEEREKEQNLQSPAVHVDGTEGEEQEHGEDDGGEREAGPGRRHRPAHGKISDETDEEDGAIELETMGKKEQPPPPQSPKAKHHTPGSLRNPVKMMGQVGSWARRETQSTARKLAAPLVGGHGRNSRAAQYRAELRRRDVEAQRAMGEALFGGIHDEIEDLTPDERDAMVRHAFQHYALRARRPVVWVPRDDVGVSDDEIARASRYSTYLWLSNEGTALDSKARVVFGQAPPDFSEIDLINL